MDVVRVSVAAEDCWCLGLAVGSAVVVCPREVVRVVVVSQCFQVQCECCHQRRIVRDLLYYSGCVEGGFVDCGREEGEVVCCKMVSMDCCQTCAVDTLVESLHVCACGIADAN